MGGGGPGQCTTVVQARDDGCSGDNGSKDGERYTIAEDTWEQNQEDLVRNW